MHGQLDCCGTHDEEPLPLPISNPRRRRKVKVKGKASSLDIAPLTMLNSGALQPRKWQLTGNDCGTAVHAVAAQSLR